MNNRKIGKCAVALQTISVLLSLLASAPAGAHGAYPIYAKTASTTPVPPVPGLASAHSVAASSSSPAEPPFLTNVRISDDPPGGGNQNEVSMGIDFQGRLLAGWNDYITTEPHYRCGTSRSLDKGQTWSASQQLHDPAYTAGADPVVTNDAVGRTYFLCLNYEPDLSASMIKAYTSLDGGQNWVNQADIGVTDPGFNDKPWGAGWGNGYLFAIWTFFYPPCTPMGCNGNDVVFRASSDAGVTWGPLVNFTTSKLGHFGQVDVDRYGRVHVTYEDDDSFYYRRSDDFGQTFTAPVFISDAGQACQGCSPARAGTIPTLSVGATGQDLYVVWNAVIGIPAPEDIYLATSHDGGATWTRTKLTSSATPVRHIWPAVDIDHDGIVHLMWSVLPVIPPPTPGWGNMSVFYTNSTDGGVTFAPLIKVNDVDFETADFMGDYQTMLVDDWGFGHIAWCDNRLGTFLAPDTEIYSTGAVLATPGPHFLDINPKDLTITAGQTVQYTATVTDPYGNVPADAIEWVVTGGAINTTGFYASGPIGTFKVRFYAGFRYAETNVTVLLGPLFRIDVTPPTATIIAGGSQQFTAAGYDAGGNPVAISPTWETNKGSIDATGLYTGTVAGNWTVYANDSGVSGSAQINVDPGPPFSIDVTPPTASITVDDTQQFTATILDVYANVVSAIPTWEVTGGSISPTGLYSPTPLGTFTVYANYSSLSDTALVTVTEGALFSLVVSPPAATITADQTQQYTAQGYDRNGNPVPSNPVWTTDAGVIDSTGLYTAGPVGTWNVTATDGSVSGNATVTVTPGALVNIVVTPATATITADQTQQYTATGYDADGNVVSISPTWSTTGGSVDSVGLYTPTFTGTYSVNASDGGITGSAEVIVIPGALASIVVTPPAAAITADQTQQFTATGYDAKGNVVPITPTWSTNTGTVDGTGLYTPTLVGTWTVTATQGGIFDTAQVTVTVGSLASIVVSPPTATMTTDETQQYMAQGFDQKGNVVAITPTWSVNNGSIDSTGLYTPMYVGTWTITAAEGAISGTATAVVTPGALASIVVTPPTATITADETQQYVATGYDAKGNVVAITPTWTVTGGTISSTGLYTGSIVGTFIVNASQGAIYGTASVTVIAGSAASIAVTPANVDLLIGDNATFTATVRDADGNIVSASVVWTVDVAGTIDTTGRFVAGSVGNATITATVAGTSISATARANVHAPPKTADLFPWWLIILAVIVVLSLIFILLLWRKKKKRQTAEESTQQAEDVQKKVSDDSQETNASLEETE